MLLALLAVTLPPPNVVLSLVQKRISEVNPRLHPCVRAQIAKALLDAAEEHSVEPLLLCALVEKESSFNPNAYSPSGAVGLGQIKPETAKILGIDNPWDIRQNLLATADYLRWMLDEFEGRKNWVELALAAYHLGPKAVGEEVPQCVKGYVDEILSLWKVLLREAGVTLPPEGEGRGS